MRGFGRSNTFSFLKFFKILNCFEEFLLKTFFSSSYVSASFFLRASYFPLLQILGFLLAQVFFFPRSSRFRIPSGAKECIT